MLHVQCPDCSKVYDVSEELAGKAAKCPECGGRIPIPQLRANAGNAANRTPPGEPKPASATSASSSSLKVANDSPTKPTSSKPSSSKATTSPPAKSKPTAKPKPAPKKRPDDDFFEDDVSDIEDYGDVEEVDEFDDDFQTATRRSVSDRTSGKKHDKKKSSRKSSSGDRNWFGAFGKLLTTDVTVISMVVFGLVFFAFCWKVNADGQQMREVAVMVFFAGVAILVVGNLWLLIKIWKINSGWGMFFLGSGALIRALNNVAPQELIIGLDVLRLLALLAFVIENWSEVKVAVAVFFMGLCMSAVPLLGLVGAGGGPVANNPAVMPPPGQAPANPFDGPVVPARNGANAENQVQSLAEAGPFPVAGVQIPTLPEFSLGAGGRGETFQVPGITCMQLFFVNGAGNSSLSSTVPGMNMKMIYFEPRGTHAPQSLPCVLIASAGSNLLVGTDCPSKEYVSETLPYVQAGFAVLGFSLDGHSKLAGGSEDQQLRIGYQQFQKAHAGMVNVRNAVEFASQKIPQVDPGRLFIAGHSSSGTLALLAAAHEPRLKGAVAYAPITDVEARLRDLLNAPGVDRSLPGVRQFAKQSSPLSHITRFNCPIFLFHAADDGNAPVTGSRKFAELLKANRKQVDYVEVPTGNHYDSMIQQGIPRAIPWLKQLAWMSGASVPATAQTELPNRPNPAVPKGAELPAFPFANLPQPANVPRQPSGRVVTFRFQSFTGKGDSTTAARKALREIAWADLNDLEIDPAKSEIRIGQLGGSVNTEPARQALTAAGFEMLPGVSIGNKSANVVAGAPPNAKSQPNKEAETTPQATTANTPAKSPPPKTASTKPTPKDTPPAASPPAKTRETQTARRIVKFRYERFSGKGSSEKAVRDALKRFEWANPEDIVLDTKDHEVRIGLLAETTDFEPARKALSNAGFVLAPGVTTATVKD